MTYVDNQETRDSLILQRNATAAALSKARASSNSPRAEIERLKGAYQGSVKAHAQSIRDVERLTKELRKSQYMHQMAACDAGLARMTIESLVVAARAMWHVLDENPDRVRDVAVEIVDVERKLIADQARSLNRDEPLADTLMLMGVDVADFHAKINEIISKHPSGRQHEG